MSPLLQRPVETDLHRLPWGWGAAGQGGAPEGQDGAGSERGCGGVCGADWSKGQQAGGETGWSPGQRVAGWAGADARAVLHGVEFLLSEEGPGQPLGRPPPGLLPRGSCSLSLTPHPHPTPAPSLTLPRPCALSPGKYHCPVLFTVFTNSSHIVAIRTTGNVYAHEASRHGPWWGHWGGWA